MKLIFYCFSCKKEHDLSLLPIDELKDIHCECGGYVITPSGKGLFQALNNEK